ncbi:hypothetical protein BOSP111201_11765 [Bordetella sputigena]|uniref:hypothetical protein n=1 Tax=Bordetella sputigena TaxID=1416810 RepID=UPI0039EF5B73
MQISSRSTGIDQGYGPQADAATPQLRNPRTEGLATSDAEQDQRLDAFLKACAETFGPSPMEPEPENRPRAIPSTHMWINPEEMRMLRQMFEARLARAEARMKHQLDRSVADLRSRVADQQASDGARSNATPKTSVKSA